MLSIIMALVPLLTGPLAEAFKAHEQKQITLAELNAKVDGPPQYWRAPPHQHKDIFNDMAFGAR